MSSPLFAVESHDDLWALWCLMIDAKFQPAQRDRLLWSSPLVRNVAAKLDEALLASYVAAGKDQHVEQHLRWRKSLPENELLEAVRSRLRLDSAQAFWRSWGAAEKKAYVRGCVVPFSPTDEFIDELVAAADVQPPAPADGSAAR